MAESREKSHGEMKPADKVKMVILAAKLAKECLELLTVSSPGLCRLQFFQIVSDLKLLDEHIKEIQ